MAQVIVICGFIFFALHWLVNETPPSQMAKCNCPKLPDNYFVVKTDETVTCLNTEREREIKQTISSAKVELR